MFKLNYNAERFIELWLKQHFMEKVNDAHALTRTCFNSSLHMLKLVPAHALTRTGML